MSLESIKISLADSVVDSILPSLAMATKAKRLEVLDFKEDEEPEIQPRKYFPKLENPNPDHDAMLKYQFLECVAPGSDAVNKGTTGDEILCVDVDEMECDNGVENGVVERVTEDAGVAKEGNYDPAPQSEACALDVSLNAENDETKSSFRVSFNEAPSLAESNLVCAVSDPPSCREPVDMKSDSDESMNENSPSSPALGAPESGAFYLVSATLSGHTSINGFSDSEIVDMDIEVDYVLYRGNFCPGCVVTFSCNDIKINGSIACGNLETLSLEKQIDDIVRIESQHVQSTKSVIVKLIISSKDASQSADVCGTSVSGIEELEFAVVEPNWSEKWDEITSLNVKYLAVWSDIHDPYALMDGGGHIHQQRSYFPSFHEAFEDVIYPKGDSDAVSLSKRDVDLLQPETFINDTIIDFYIKYLKNQIPSEKKPRFHFFNSFFFRKLADLDKDPSSASDGKAAFLRVRKWTRKVDIFGTEYIFIPVNFNLHWSLLVFCHLGEVAGLKDEGAGKLLRVPCILHMDSIRGTHAGLKDLVQSYLWEEWKEREKETSEELSSKFLNLQFVSLEIGSTLFVKLPSFVELKLQPISSNLYMIFISYIKLPQQENSYDCGLFLLHYLELFLEEAPEDFSPFRIHNFSNFLNVDWFHPAEASVKRVRIQNLIFELLKNHSQEVSSDSSDGAEHDFPEINQKESGVDFVSGRCAPSLANQRNLLSSESARGIEITLLEASSMRDAQCVNDPGLVLRQLFEPGGSLLPQCSSFDQQSSYCHLNAATPPVEDDAEIGEDLLYGDYVLQQMANLTPHDGSMPFSTRGFAHSSWHQHADTYMQTAGDDESSSETSLCPSDDSDVGIIEDGGVESDAALCQKERVDEQRSPSLEQGLASPSNEMLENSADGVAEDLACDGGTTSEVSEDPVGDEGCDDLCIGNENGDVISCQETENPPESLHEEPNVVENGLNEELTRTPQEEPKVVENGSHEDMITPLHDENPKVVENEFPRDTEKVMVLRDDKPAPGHDMLVEEDEQRVAKRLRLSPILEGEEGLNWSLSKDFHL